MLEHVKKKRIVFYAVLAGGVNAIGFCLMDTYWPNMPIWVPLLFVFMQLLMLISYVARQLWVHQRQQTLEIHRWNEAWASIRSLLTFDYPLPPITSFTIAPDAALYILQEVLTHKPKHIMELGGGLSTILIAKLIKQYKLDCRLTTIESDEDYLQNLQAELGKHGLSEGVQCIYAPIGERLVHGEKWPWYQFDATLWEEIQLLVIDGPPKSIGKMSRYPVLPVLQDKLSAVATIIADDAGRPDMKKTIGRWETEFPAWSFRAVHLSRTIMHIRN